MDGHACPPLFRYAEDVGYCVTIDMAAGKKNLDAVESCKYQGGRLLHIENIAVSTIRLVNLLSTIFDYIP